MTKFFFFFFFLLIASPVFSNCTFKSGNYIKDLQDPSNVLSLNIKVAKSSKYARNMIKIMTSESENIPPKLKKKFIAKITVKYPFGTCNFNGLVRQNGDLKDHIRFEGGNIFRSLDVKLKDGNILSAVKFKLLLPETRNSASEILATVILKRLGIISPETFSTQVTVNGVTAAMLFQEKASKELLERNFRRESAIFEGDEELLWSFKGHTNFELEPLALSRMLNSNWFLKGSSSQAISLDAFTRLQRSYLNYAQNIDENQGLVIFPNKTNSEFEEFAFILIAMNAFHAMSPNNRKYYYNTITGKFEPIYYDGNVKFVSLDSMPSGFPYANVIKKQFPKGIDKKFVSSVNDAIMSDYIKREFLKRVNYLALGAEKFFENAVQQMIKNIAILSYDIVKSVEKKVTHKPNVNIEEFIKDQKSFGLDQLIFINLQKKGDIYEGTFHNGEKVILSIDETLNLISKNRYKGNRAVLLGKPNLGSQMQPKGTKIQGLSGEIFASKGINITVFQSKKEIIIQQTRPDDWAMISGANLLKWIIRFEGVKSNKNIQLNLDQRFNNFGITGCLTIYDTNFNQTNVEVYDGKCEDSLNIISSNGQIEKITIQSAFSDAIDIDFSDINISEVDVKNAINDCFDVSWGRYFIDNAVLKGCGDKGISVGENSTFIANKLKVHGANIGVSSKDYSEVKIYSAVFDKLTTCIEAKQKKQEFGGAFISINTQNCEGKIRIDKNSILEVRNQ